MKLFALSDVHVRHPVNLQALEQLPARPEDWLVLAGDVCETAAQLAQTLDALAPKFARLIWVPGNHELWTLPNEAAPLRGQAKYDAMVALCRARNVLTPEDPFPVWPGEGPALTLAPLFVLYDYSFRPADVPEDRALLWAMEAGLLCTDEALLHPDPYPSRKAWCQARVELSEARLAQIPANHQTVLINHFPLREEHVRLWRIPRFSIWCGTKRTEDWHRRFRARVVVSGHLHIRATDWRDGVRFEEVSLGYPGQWDPSRGAQSYLREILPGPPDAGA